MATRNMSKTAVSPTTKKDSLPKRITQKYRLGLLAKYFELLQTTPEKNVSLLTFENITLFDLFFLRKDVATFIHNQLILLFQHFNFKEHSIDLFPFLNTISFSFSNLMGRGITGPLLLNDCVLYCVMNEQEKNFTQFMKKIATRHPVQALQIKRQIPKAIANYLEEYNKPVKTDLVDVTAQLNKKANVEKGIKLLVANYPGDILKARQLTAEQKEQLLSIMPELAHKAAKPKRAKKMTADAEMEPLLTKSGTRTNPLYTLSKSLPEDPTAEDLQFAIHETYENDPPRKMWFNYFFRSCFPSKTPKTKNHVKNVAKLMDDIEVFFEACNDKIEEPILRAEDSVVKSIKKVFPSAQVDWMFGNTEECLKEFDRLRRSEELQNTLCLNGNEPSVFSVFYYCIDQAIRILQFDNTLKVLMKNTLGQLGINLNEKAAFEDINDLIHGLALAQDEHLGLTAQQQLHVLDVLFSTLFKHFYELKQAKPNSEVDDFLRTICLHWWEICRVSPKEVQRKFYQELTTVKHRGSVQHLELKQLQMFMKPHYAHMTEIKDEQQTDLRDGLKLVIANETRKSQPPGIS